MESNMKMDSIPQWIKSYVGVSFTLFAPLGRGGRAALDPVKSSKGFTNSIMF